MKFFKSVQYNKQMNSGYKILRFDNDDLQEMVCLLKSSKLFHWSHYQFGQIMTTILKG